MSDTVDTMGCQLRTSVGRQASANIEDGKGLRLSVVAPNVEAPLVVYEKDVYEFGWAGFTGGRKRVDFGAGSVPRGGAVVVVYVGMVVGLGRSAGWVVMIMMMRVVYATIMPRVRIS
eukprot:65230-Amorphochlora_amoeboformis.AAC.2